jgi:RimJ/RimL family protein N-acetyltransferase
MTVKNDSTLSEQSARVKHNDIQSTQSEGVKTADKPIQIRPLILADREILLEMYRTFEPLGGAQGLPPRVEEARQTWIDRALQGEVNVGAFSAGGDLAGHSFLASSNAGEAELAIFVHQRSRQGGVGTELLRAVLQRAEQLGLRRIRAVTTPDNIPKLHLLKRRGFRFLQPTYGAEVLVLDLPVPAFT